MTTEQAHFCKQRRAYFPRLQKDICPGYHNADPQLHPLYNALPVPPERKSVVPLPRLSAASVSLVKAVALVYATRSLASGGKATGLTVFMNWLDNPVDARILADSLVIRVDKDDLEVFVGRVLVDPIRVKDAKIGATAAHSLLGSRAERALVLQLVYTLVDGLACG